MPQNPNDYADAEIQAPAHDLLAETAPTPNPARELWQAEAERRYAPRTTAFYEYVTRPRQSGRRLEAYASQLAPTPQKEKAPMRILVCGGREYCNREQLYDTLDSYPTPAAIIEGGAQGADRFAREWATERGIQVETFPADWKTHGKSAGPIRNQQMLKEGRPDLVVAFAGGKGTQHMMTIARNAGVKVDRWNGYA